MSCRDELQKIAAAAPEALNVGRKGVVKLIGLSKGSPSLKQLSPDIGRVTHTLRKGVIRPEAVARTTKHDWGPGRFADKVVAYRHGEPASAALLRDIPSKLSKASPG